MKPRPERQLSSARASRSESAVVVAGGGDSGAAKTRSSTGTRGLTSTTPRKTFADDSVVGWVVHKGHANDSLEGAPNVKDGHRQPDEGLCAMPVCLATRLREWYQRLARFARALRPSWIGRHRRPEPQLAVRMASPADKDEVSIVGKVDQAGLVGEHKHTGSQVSPLLFRVGR